MASSLTRSTGFVRKIIVFFIIFVIFVFIIDFVMALLTEEKKTLTPLTDNTKGYLAADKAFGDIPKFEMKSLTLPENNLASYASTSKLPSFPPTVNVYKIAKPTESFLSVPNAQDIAARLKFDPSAYSNNTDDELFWSVQNQIRTFTYNKLLDIYSFKTDPTKDLNAKELLNTPLITESDYYKRSGMSMLNSLSIDNKQFSESFVRQDYININSDDSYTRVVQPRDGSFVRLAYYKVVESSSLREGYKPGPNEEDPSIAIRSEVRKTNYLDAPLTMVLQAEGRDPESEIISLDYFDQKYTSIGVYTLIRPEEAWLNVQNNKGYLYWLRPEGKNVFDEYEPLGVTRFDVQPEKTRIVYIEPDEWLADKPFTQFLQPFYIFEGIAKLQDGREAEFAFLIEALNNSSYIE